MRSSDVSEKEYILICHQEEMRMFQPKCLVPDELLHLTIETTFGAPTQRKIKIMIACEKHAVTDFFSLEGEMCNSILILIRVNDV